MAQAISRRPLTAEARFRSRVSPCGICGGQSGTETGFSPSTSVFLCQFHSTGAPLQGKTKKLMIFITGLHNKPEDCGASVASAAGPLKNNCRHLRFRTTLSRAMQVLKLNSRHALYT
jgi:hypothetical protein